MTSTKPYMELFDDQGASQGLWISAELWDQVSGAVLPILREAAGDSADAIAPEPDPEVAEPMADWNMLMEYWDFSYPLEPAAACSECGSNTSDWLADEPRKFRLKSATFGGLVSFQCLACKARVVKRHFKDGIEEETIPFTE